MSIVVFSRLRFQSHSAFSVSEATSLIPASCPPEFDNLVQSDENDTYAQHSTQLLALPLVLHMLPSSNSNALVAPIILLDYISASTSRHYQITAYHSRFAAIAFLLRPDLRPYLAEYPSANFQVHFVPIACLGHSPAPASLFFAPIPFRTLLCRCISCTTLYDS